MKSVNEFLINHISWILGGSIILTIFAPILFTQCNLYSKIYFSSDTGSIGDTIGGSTAPIIGLLNAVLLYLAFKAQLDANSIIQNQRNEDEKKRTQDLYNKEIEFLYCEITQIINSFKYNNYSGNSAYYEVFDKIIKSRDKKFYYMKNKLF